MMRGYEEPFKRWFDVHLFSEMDPAKATKEKKKKEESITDRVASRIQIATSILGPRETCKLFSKGAQICPVLLRGASI